MFYFKNVIGVACLYLFLLNDIGTARNDECWAELSKTDALTFLSNGKRATPKECCEEGPCEKRGAECKTEQYRSFIARTHSKSCPAGQVMKITNLCPGHANTECSDPCKSLSREQCENGGTCVSAFGGKWSCSCQPGYYGTICQVDIDYCQSNHCNSLYTEKCQNFPGHYQCDCKPGYKGVNCDMEIDECASTPCQHGGTCNDHVNGYTCVCVAGYTGVNCQTDIDDCLSNPCNSLYSERCQNLRGRYQCDCIPGYTGVNCDTEIDECASTPCQHGGTCNDHVNGYTCVCVAGYTGVNCQTDIDECSSNPCQNNATCHNSINRFSCECPPRIYGTICDTNICHPTPADVVFVLDSSVSMLEYQFNKQLEFVANFTDNVIVGPRDFQISVITYSFDAHVEFFLDQYTDNSTLKDAISNVTYKPGATFTDKGLEAVKTVFSSGHGVDRRINGTSADRFVYLLTDGMSNDRRRTKKIANEIRIGYDVKLAAIGIGEMVSHQELIDMASKSDGVPYVYSVNNFNSLYTLLKQLVHYTCDECERSYKSDISIVIDTSYDVTPAQSKTSFAAVYHLLDLMDLGVDKAHVSVSTFNTRLTEVFNYSHTSKDTMKAMLNKITVSTVKSKMNIWDVLKQAEKYILSNGRNSSDVRRFLLVATNGQFGEIDVMKLDQQNNSLKLNQIQTIVVGSGNEANVEGLLSIVSDSFNVFLCMQNSSMANLNVLKTDFVYNKCDLKEI